MTTNQLIAARIIVLEILADFGCMGFEEARQLAAVMPDVQCGIKFGCSPRVECKVSEVEGIIKSRIGETNQPLYIMNEDYVHEVFITATECDRLKQIFGLPECFPENLSKE